MQQIFHDSLRWCGVRCCLRFFGTIKIRFHHLEAARSDARRGGPLPQQAPSSRAQVQLRLFARSFHTERGHKKDPK
jgi:hypothetical protein